MNEGRAMARFVLIGWPETFWAMGQWLQIRLRDRISLKAVKRRRPGKVVISVDRISTAGESGPGRPKIGVNRRR
jgi:hypothetical protein